jgi:hypothetical protein
VEQSRYAGAEGDVKEADMNVTDLENSKPIDPEDPQVHRMLANLQGNILKGHAAITASISSLN